MQKRSLIILAIGLVIAVGTAWSLSKRMGARDATAATQVMVAATDIAPGSFVRSGYHLAFVDWPSGNITDTMITNGQAKLSDFEGAVARRPITKGEPITKTLLVKANEGGFMSSVLDPGKRAVSIAVDPTTGNAGFIFPGDHVDLILSHKVDSDQQQVRASETFIEDVRVLAVDQMLDNPENKAVLAKTVTLEVTPKQAEEINVAKDLGKISLSLRSLSDKPQADAATQADPQPEVSFDDVLKADEAPSEGGTTITRDTDVSRIISPGGGAATHVRVIRGNTQQDLDFGPGAIQQQNSAGVERAQ
jgi:pilus assembly protein CpaB